jgi:ABC-type multidrug transport system ATPase subunit/pSer/pThr/pTyr-binding forkhead associated (FHA) protein
MLGRVAENTIHLDDSQVSRYHARIEWSSGAPQFVDLGSANGSTLNGAPAAANTPLAISPGDKIQIGPFLLEFQQPAIPARTATDGQPLPEDQPAMLVQAEPASFELAISSSTSDLPDFPLKAETVSMGRSPENDLMINLPVISRHHARLQRTAYGYQITDLGSANGLTLQERAVSELLLADGDTVAIAGDVRLVYRISMQDSPAPTAQFAAPVVTPEPEKIAQPEPVIVAAAAGATLIGMAPEAVTTVQKIDLRQQSTLTLGRAPDNDLVLDHPSISRHHARIARVGQTDQFFIEDLHSSNGTTVNDQLIEPGKPYPLVQGNTVRIGPVKFLFAPEVLHATDESRDLRLDALHLNQFVGKGVNLLQDISLSVKPREFVAVVGVSGAGKSTFMNALTGFKPASDGTVMVNNTDLYKNYNAYRTDIGYVPQDDIIHRELPVGRALDYVARLRLPADTSTDERRKIVREEMETLGLAERAGVPVGSLSGGQRKRVSIGVERITRPGLFFLDEATSGLDPGTENQLMRMLRQLADQGQTILLITHATKNVVLCDLVVFLAKGGHLAYFGPPDQALAHFGVKDFDEIYEKLMNEKSPQEWADLYKRSPQYRQYVVERLQANYGELLEVTPKAPSRAAAEAGRLPKKKVKGPSSFRQFAVLTQRNLEIIRTDKKNLLLLLLLGPLLGLLGFLIWDHTIFDPVEGDAFEVMTLLFLASIIPFLIGSLSSMREIVKEKAIYLRERTVNLKILPYVASKMFVGLLLSLYSAAALLAVMLIKVDFSHMDAGEIGLFYLLLAVSVMSGVMWGLLVSALASREEQAVLLVILVVVLHMVFSGGLFNLSSLDTAGDIIGGSTSTKWVFEGMIDVTGLMEGDCETPGLTECIHPGLQGIEGDGPVKEAKQAQTIENIRDRFGDVFEGKVLTSLLADLVIMVILFGLIIVIQKRKDVI